MQLKARAGLKRSLVQILAVLAKTTNGRNKRATPQDTDVMERSRKELKKRGSGVDNDLVFISVPSIHVPNSSTVP